ncbi:MAG: mechanosensitive ion channel family protein [Tissierellia bacterium]|nr:mechanosensitive ion channel family protein [Tissierellia bacterium]
MDTIRSWMINDMGSLTFIGKLTFTLIVIVITFILVKIVKKALSKALKISKVKNEGKLVTMNQILVKLLYVIAYFIAIVLILDTFGVNTGAILATAGIGGVAIGFGAQYIVRDIISGMVILMEDQFNVGDLVTIDGATGYVEEVGLRLTKLRDFTGDIHIIQNGNIKVVSNKSRGPQRAWVNIYLPHDSEYKKVFNIMKQVCDDVKKKYPDITEGPTVVGITDICEYDMKMSIKAMADVETYLDIEREIRKDLLIRFVEEGVELPKVIAESGGNNEV